MLIFVMRQLKLFKKSKRGRPKKKDRGVSHLRREVFRRRLPAHVTLRVVKGVQDLQHGRWFKAIRGAFFGGNNKFGMRLVHFAVLGNHVHMICEADDTAALSRGMQGLEIRMAKALNRAQGRSGTVFSDRYHARILRTPAQTKNAVRYVLRNHERHFGEGVHGISSLWFPELTLPAQTWLVRRAME